MRRISRSVRRSMFSLRNRANSSRSDSDNASGSASRCALSRSAYIQFANVESEIPSDFAISTRGRSELFTNSIASRRNSGGYFDGRPIEDSLLWPHARIRCPRSGVNRNHEFGEYRALVERWAPEIELGELTSRVSPTGLQLDLFYDDEGHRVPKEVCWAGDGLQVWLQVLYHVYRLRSVDVLVLDEPDIYLHADLQRRLVQILEEIDAQTVLASHSPEVLGEAHTDHVLWVDKSRRRAVRGSDGLAQSAEAIGSQFNVRIARALRSSLALFVEGKDMKIVRSLARSAGAMRIADERGLAVVPLDGFSNRTNVTPFKFLVDEFLEGSVQGFVILDRDYRSEEACEEILSQFRGIDVGCHIWKKKEIESYLLIPSLLARTSGLPVPSIESALTDIAEGLRGKVFARALAAVEEERVSPRMHRVNVIEEFEPVFARTWAVPDRRMGLVPPKEVLSQLNSRISSAGGKPVSTMRLAKSMRSSEINPEVHSLFDRVEALLIGGRDT